MKKPEEFTPEEIDSVIHLARWLAKYQDVLNDLRRKAIAPNVDTRDMLIMEWPIVQGTSNQIQLTKLGRQEIDLDKINEAVKLLTKDDLTEEEKLCHCGL